jgi:peptidoglycan hydrolase CwlO-like protein
MEELISVASLVGILSGIVFSYIGYQRGIKKDVDANGVRKGSIYTDIEYIKRKIDDVAEGQKDTNKVISSLMERIIRVEEMSKSAHKRIDDIESDCRDCKRER